MERWVGKKVERWRSEEVGRWGDGKERWNGGEAVESWGNRVVCWRGGRRVGPRTSWVEGRSNTFRNYLDS